MNKRAFRLIFSRRLRMWLAVSEVSPGQGKATKVLSAPAAWGVAVAAAFATPGGDVVAQTRTPITFASKLPAPKVNLPQPYTKVFNAPGAPKANQFVNDPAAQGKVSWTVDGKTATFNQGTVPRVILNWASFDIGAGYAVRFVQDPDPTKNVSALNRVWSTQPSIIQGSLEANREVMLVNTQGVYFGSAARVNAGRFVASTHSVSNAVFEKGIRNVVDGAVVFSTAGTDHLPTDLNSAISVEPGAQISGDGVYLIAPRVVNQGRIDTPAGQSILAAGDKVYLMSSSDPAQRGLIVAVDPIKRADGSVDTELGIVENAADGRALPTAGLVQKINEIRADSGTVNLVGLMVRQNGVVNATTAVKGANGAIYLQAMASTVLLDATSEPLTNANSDTLRRGLLVEPSAQVRASAELGTVQFGANSLTAVRPNNSAATQLDAEVFNPSVIRAEGKAIVVDKGAQVVAPAGRIDLLAARTTERSALFDNQAGPSAVDDSRVVVAPGAVVSAAGLRDVAVDGARNQGALRLFRIELADAPVQRDTPLYRSPVLFDLRDASKISTAAVGGAAAAITRTAQERATPGGNVTLASNGALVVAEDALLDVSGGSIQVSATTLQNTLLVQDGRVVTFRSSAAGSAVTSVLPQTQATAAPAYVEGASGGSLTLNAASMALRGQLAGGVVTAALQRDGRSAAAKPGRLQLGRNFGDVYGLQRIDLRSTRLATLLPTLDPALFINPVTADLSALAPVAELSLSAVSAGGFGSLLLRANEVTQPEFGTLDLGAGGELDILVGKGALLNGSFSAAGGRISVVSNASAAGRGDVQLSAATRLDTAGRWFNNSAGGAGGESEAQTSAPTLAINGGRVTVAAPQSLQIDAGAVLDVSAGAALNAAGAVSKGVAGTISLSGGRLTENGATQGGLTLAGADLRGFGFSSGGKLNLSAQNLLISNDRSADSAASFALAPEFFSAGGFDSISVNAVGDVRLASGTTLTPQLRSWQFGSGWRQAASGTLSDAVATADVLDTAATERRPVNLSVAATRPLQLGGADVVVERGARVELDPGARLAFSATRSIEVGNSGGAAGQRSTLRAPGGAIAMNLLGNRGGDVNQDPVGFLGEQAIWLGPDAVLSTSGLAQTRRDTAATATAVAQFSPSSAAATPLDQRVTGQVWGGGSINLSAARGYVVAQPGAVVTLDGAAADLNFPGLAQAVTVAKPAGILNVSSPEGIYWDASVSAQAPRDTAGRALADGGRLNVSVGAGGVLPNNAQQGRAYPDAPRSVVVGGEQALLVLPGVSFGSDLSQSLGNGSAFFAPSLLTTSGFESVQLAAGDVIRFDRSTQLSMPLGLQLNTPAIAGRAGTQVVLNTTSAQIGDASSSRQGALPDTRAEPDASANRDTTLTVNASDIDVYGNLGLKGFSRVNLNATAGAAGVIRFSAAAPSLGFVETFSRQLNFAGELKLTAAQVYSTTATQYSLNGLPASSAEDAGSRLLVEGVARPDQTKPLPPLTAFASLTVNATDIEQGGTLRQPFGAIALNAERSLRLGEGSVTSVSSAGASALFGQTVNLTAWQPAGLAGVAVDTVSALPVSNGVQLRAAQITTATTAQVGAAGAGMLRAWEFFPGVGGSQDYFDTPGLFAVLPDYANAPSMALNGGIVSAAQAGQQLHVTMPGSGLASGRYTLLPARMALLAGDLPQGAYLVRRASDPGKAVLKAPILQDDGGVVVTGFISGSASRDAGLPGERFVIEPAATYRAKSEIRVSDVSRLLLEQAAAAGQSRPALPGDGGRVQVQVASTTTNASTDTTRSLWQAQLDLGVPTPAAQALGLQAGQLDMAATRLALVDSLAKTPDGALGVSADTITRSGAASVLLGGNRSTDSSVNSGADAATRGVRIDSSGTQSVLVDIGSQTLQTNELLLTARDTLTLAAGTQISSPVKPASAPAPDTTRLRLTGDGALVAVSGNKLQVQRDSATLTQGQLSVGAGSVLQGQQMTLDATGALQIDASARLPAKALDLGARRLVVGEGAAADATTEAATNANTTTISGALLAAVQAAPDLSLRAYSSIDFVGEQNWSQRTGDISAAPSVVKQRLLLDAPVVRGLLAADGSSGRTDIAAQDLVVRNASGLLPDTTLTGQGSLTLQALPPLRWGYTGGLSLGPGAVNLGFDAVALRSTGDIVLQGQGSTTAQQDLRLSAARVTATTGAQQALVAGGELLVEREASSRTLNERVGQGAAVNLSARHINQQGVLDLPGALLSLRASGDTSEKAAISFGAGSLTSVAGFALSGPDGFVVYGNAGNVQAQATQGRIDVLGTLDVSAAKLGDSNSGKRGEGDAGSITLQAAGTNGQVTVVPGTLQGQSGAAAADLGGRLLVDTTRLPSLDVLAQAATAGGMTGELDVRVREGDLTLNQNVTAQRISIAADAGNLSLANTVLQATSPAGGVVQLFAGIDLVLGEGSRIDARSQRTGANGGDVLLSSGTSDEAGRTRLSTNVVVDASGTTAQDGRIVLRTMRGADGESVQIDALNTSNLRAGAVDIEAVRVYSDVATIAQGSSSDEAVGQATLAADNARFISQATAPVLQALGVSSAEARSRVQLLPGVELRSSGDITVLDDWKLNSNDSSAVAGNAGYLTLRAVGDVNFFGGLSSGFTNTSRTAAVLNDNSRAWSYRVAAGADLGAANTLAVIDFNQIGAVAGGNVTIDSGKQLRTGAGAISIAAGRDLVFSTPAEEGVAAGSVFVAGRKRSSEATLVSSLFARTSAKPVFTEQGGRLDIFAARDVVSPEATQWINNWFWRSAALDLSEQNYAGVGQLAWWSQFSKFEQTLGSFGGGNLAVRAGRDLINVQALAPSSGFADDSRTSVAQLRVFNGGDVSVNAGRDVQGGQFLVGRGQGRVNAGGAVAQAVDNVNLRATNLALMDGDWRVAARAGISLGGVFNPTAVAASASDNRAGVSGYFYSWGPQAALQVRSHAGAVQLGDEAAESTLQTLGLDGSAPQAYAVMPPTLKATALGGPLQLTAPASVMFPSAMGQLELWSGADISSSGPLVMSGSAPQTWPTARAPASFGNNTITTTLVPNALLDKLPLTALHANDTEPVRIHAEGSLLIQGNTAPSAQTPVPPAALLLPKPARISARNDIVQFSLRGQHLLEGDYTTITAGRNLLAGRFGGIELAGPGSLEISAGRQLDLGSSAGVLTTGNVRNAELVPQGASVSLSAATAGTLNAANFLAAYLQTGTDSSHPRASRYRADLVAFMQQGLNLPTTDASFNFDKAWAEFQKLPARAQAGFGKRVLDAELAATYLTSSVPSQTQMLESLRTAFERHKAQVLKAGDEALKARLPLTLPGREVLEGEALNAYLAQIRGLEFSSLNLDSTVAARVASLQKLQEGWRSAVASRTGQAEGAALDKFSGRTFEAYRTQLLEQEVASAGLLASNFGRLSLPMRLALFEDGFRAAELAGAGSFVPQAIWPAAPETAPVMGYSGSLNMTQSSVVTERGGGIRLLNAGGAINVGLKQAATGTLAPKGVITLGGGNIFGYAKDDFQVNTQRVFVVGQGDMAIWSSSGDIDSGRGANTAVAAPPLAARRSADGVVFETPATTTGSGLGILEDASGRRRGSIGLYPAFGEILALDAFIRAPSVVLGSSIQGADNLVSASVGGAAAPVAAPPVVAAAPTSNADTKATTTVGSTAAQEARPRNSLLTVELLGLGSAADNTSCDETQRREGKCPPVPPPATPPASCSAEQKANGTCKPAAPAAPAR
jgi:filamentous hemagglutinin